MGRASRPFVFVLTFPLPLSSSEMRLFFSRLRLPRDEPGANPRESRSPATRRWRRC